MSSCGGCLQIIYTFSSVNRGLSLVLYWGEFSQLLLFFSWSFQHEPFCILSSLKGDIFSNSITINPTIPFMIQNLLQLTVPTAAARIPSISSQLYYFII